MHYDEAWLADRDRRVHHPVICLTWCFFHEERWVKGAVWLMYSHMGRIWSARLSVPVLEQMGKVASHQKCVDHVVPAKALHDRLDWVGLKVLRGWAGQIEGQQGETWGRWNKKKKGSLCLIYLFLDSILFYISESVINRIILSDDPPSLCQTAIQFLCLHVLLWC